MKRVIEVMRQGNGHALRAGVDAQMAVLAVAGFCRARGRRPPVGGGLLRGRRSVERRLEGAGVRRAAARARGPVAKGPAASGLGRAPARRYGAEHEHGRRPRRRGPPGLRRGPAPRPGRDARGRARAQHPRRGGLQRRRGDPLPRGGGRAGTISRSVRAVALPLAGLRRRGGAALRLLGGLPRGRHARGVGRRSLHAGAGGARGHARARRPRRGGARRGSGPQARARTLPETRGGIWFAGEASVDPRLLGRALHAAAARAGPPSSRARCEGIAVEGGRVVGVDHESGRIPAGAVVLAAGAWSMQVRRATTCRPARCGPVRGQIAVLDTRPPLLSAR